MVELAYTLDSKSSAERIESSRLALPNTKHAWSGTFPCMETSMKHLEVGLIISAEVIIRTRV